MTRVVLTGTLAVLVSFGVAPRVHAGGDVTRLRAPMTTDGLIGVEGTDALPPLHWNAALAFGYAYNPLVWRFSDGTYEPVIEHQLTAELVGTIGLFRFVDVGVALPFLLYQDGPPAPTANDPDPFAVNIGTVSGSGVGDLRVMPRLQFADERTYGMGGALVCEFTFNTGEVMGGSQRYFGDNGVGLRPRIVTSLPLSFGRLIGSLGLRLRLGGARGVADSGFDHEFEYAAGGEFYVLQNDIPLSALVEVAGALGFGFNGSGQFPLELRAGARTRLADNIIVAGSMGFGLSGGLGTPTLRFLLNFAWAPRAEDQDGDGIPDAIDYCPYEPEDADGFQDDDGCPDLDNDFDRIPDDLDACPNDPEDFNDYKDEDGCPDAAELDTDKDGIPDQRDRCPTDPEDKDGFKDDDGCPDIDNDRDGVADTQDKCVGEAETINGVDDEDGCPDEGEGETTVLETKIDIKESILFESGKAIIKEESKAILDQVALQMLAHPEIELVRIEGHTDSAGPEEDNLFLSQDRADAVRRYLIGRGVSKYKLEAVGFGESQPIAPNNTTAGRAKNRRVEFVIAKQTKK
jgi:outer membrane protein OmpA-like peptidoglycan-associated protein